MSALAPLSTKLKVINLWGAPGVGKSAARSGVFWLMKSYHLSVEEVTEHAKFLVLSGQQAELVENQPGVLKEQFFKQKIVADNGYEYAVTDSPLPLVEFYSPPGKFPGLSHMVDEDFSRFDNINFFVTRDVHASGAPFEHRGRMHGLKDFVPTETRMKAFMHSKGIEFVEMPLDIYTPWRILEALKPGLALWPSFKLSTA